MSGSGDALSSSLTTNDVQIEIKSTDSFKNDSHSSVDSVPKHEVEQSLMGKRVWNDVWAIVFYYLNFLMFCCLCIAGIYKLSEPHNQALLTLKGEIISNLTNSVGKDVLRVKMIRIALPIAIGISVILTFIYALILYFFAKKMIISFHFISIVIIIGCGLRLFSLHQWYEGAFLCGGGLILGIWFCCIYSRLDFSVQIIKPVMRLVPQYPHVALMTLVTILLQIVVTLLWGYGILGWKLTFATNIGALISVHLILLFSLFWNARFLNNSLCTACSGVFCAYHFLDKKVKMPQRPFRAVVMNTVGPGSGSIAFGSLVDFMMQCIPMVAPLISEKTVLKRSRLRSNRYVFVLIAIYGKSFYQSAKTCADLFGQRGFSAIAKDNLAKNVLLLGGVDVGFLSGVGGWLAVTEGSRVLNSPYDIDMIVGFVCGLIGFFIFSVFSTLISSGLTCFCVCLAQNSPAVFLTEPNLCAQFLKVYPNIQDPVTEGNQ